MTGMGPGTPMGVEERLSRAWLLDGAHQAGGMSHTPSPSPWPLPSSLPSTSPCPSLTPASPATVPCLVTFPGGVAAWAYGVAGHSLGQARHLLEGLGGREVGNALQKGLAVKGGRCGSAPCSGSCGDPHPSSTPCPCSPPVYLRQDGPGPAPAPVPAVPAAAVAAPGKAWGN